VSATSSYPPQPCKRCGKIDANWIVSSLGCAHCFDPFTTAAQLAALQKIAALADDLAHGRGSMQALERAIADWQALSG
jgi:hypothetical protein